MVTDIALMGPHAIAAYHGRKLALEQFGVTPHAIMLNEETRAVAKRTRQTRALAVQEEHAVVAP